MLKRSGRELIENSRDDTTWVKVQLQELSNRWDTVCKLSVSKQSRLEQALKQVSKRLQLETGLESFTCAAELCPGDGHKPFPWIRLFAPCAQTQGFWLSRTAEPCSCC